MKSAGAGNHKNLGQTIASQSMDSVSQNVGQTLRAVKS